MLYPWFIQAFIILLYFIKFIWQILLKIVNFVKAKKYSMNSKQFQLYNKKKEIRWKWCWFLRKKYEIFPVGHTATYFNAETSLHSIAKCWLSTLSTVTIIKYVQMFTINNFLYVFAILRKTNQMKIYGRKYFQVRELLNIWNKNADNYVCICVCSICRTPNEKIFQR